MTVTDIREWKLAKRRREIRESLSREAEPDLGLLAEMEAYCQRKFNDLESGAITLADIVRQNEYLGLAGVYSLRLLPN